MIREADLSVIVNVGTDAGPAYEEISLPQIYIREERSAVRCTSSQVRSQVLRVTVPRQVRTRESNAQLTGS